MAEAERRVVVEYLRAILGRCGLSLAVSLSTSHSL